MRSTSILSAVAALVATAVADFYIYEMDTIAADPYAGGGMSAIFQHLPSMTCDDLQNTKYVGWVGDASDGGVRCKGCSLDADSVNDWDIEELEWKDVGLTTWNTGWVTLYKSAADPARYDMTYVTDDRSESGTITNSWCERVPSDDRSCTGGGLANSIYSTLFVCHTSITSMQNP